MEDFLEVYEVEVQKNVPKSYTRHFWGHFMRSALT